MPRRILVAFFAPLLALVTGCDDYYDAPPPATAATVNDPQAATDQTVEAQGDNYADTDPSALSDFKTTLDPHGQWVEDPAYGTVWQPSAAEVGADFSPYETAGHWAYDDDDYVWVSDYEWGWAPFHYGRWVLGSYGWVWIPGRVYAPAWVDWRFGYPGYAYVGWGPAYPTFIWRAGVPVGYVAVAPPAHFYYCAHADIFAPSIGARVVTGPAVVGIAAHTGFYAGGTVATAPPAGGAMHGPAPASMGIAPSAVTHVPPGDKGTAMAKGFAHPSTATKMGAHPPVNHTVKKPGGAKPKGGGFRGGGAHGGGFHGGGGHR